MIGTGEEGAGSLRRGTAVDGTTTDQYFPDARTNGRTSCHRSQIYAGERQVPCRSKDMVGTQDTELRDGLAVQLRRDSCEGPDF